MLCDAHTIRKTTAPRKRFAALTLLLAALAPLIAPPPTARAAEHTGREDAARARAILKRYREMLPNDARVEILAVGKNTLGFAPWWLPYATVSPNPQIEHPRGPEQWWLPDGTPLTHRPFDVQATPLNEKAVRQAVRIGGQVYVLRMRVSVLNVRPDPEIIFRRITMQRQYRPAPDVDIGVVVPQANLAEHYKDPFTTPGNLWGVSYVDPPARIAARIGVSFGEWSVFAHPAKIEYGQPKYTGYRTKFRIVHPDVDMERWDLLLFVKEKSGDIVKGYIASFKNVEGGRQVSRFRTRWDTRPDQIRSYHLKKRRMYWVTIPKIALRPNDADPISPAAVDWTPPHDEGLSFGPVIERTLTKTSNDSNERGQGALIDLDTGELFAVPEELRTSETQSGETSDTAAFLRWAQSKGIDAMLSLTPYSRGLIGIDMSAAPTANPRWDDESARSMRLFMRYADPGTPVPMPAEGELPRTYLFMTREGGAGILQITGFLDEEPRGVKIRYKLVQGNMPRVR